MTKLVSFESIVAASHRIRGGVKKTPCSFSARLSNMLKADIFLKTDNLQHTGAYKERGALNKLMSLNPEERARGVVAASAGNHAQGLAYHAGRLGIQSTIFMPVNTPLIKVTRTRGYGASVVLTGASFDEAFMACEQEVERSGAVLVHPFDDPAIIAGQGTMGLEIMEQVEDLDMIVVPIGGGGLISGIARVAKEIKPSIKIIGVEPTALPSMKLAVRNEPPVTGPVYTIADGIAVLKVGKITTDMCRELVDEYVTVTDEEICRTILYLIESEKTVAEGAGAAAVAALMTHKIVGIEHKRIAACVCGGNIDVNVMAQVIECGLVDSGRRVKLQVMLHDKPGSLSDLMKDISRHAANVVSVHHERTLGPSSLGHAKVLLILDVRGIEHSQEILADISKKYRDVAQLP